MKAKFEIIRKPYGHDKGFDVETELAVSPRGIHVEYGYWEQIYNNPRKASWEPKPRYFVTPREGDVLRHIPSGRTFSVGKCEGFINYKFDLLENGKKVATLHYEDYYKD